MFFRLIKPEWGRLLIEDKPNPKFKSEIKGPNTIEGIFEPSFLKEKNKEGYNIYFFPNHPSDENIYSQTYYLSGRHIDQFNCCFVDMDLKDKQYESKEHFLHRLEQFPLKPTFVVDSGHGIHAYWAIADLTRDMYVKIQLALIETLNTDTSIWTVLQIMRYPGYKNTKEFGASVKCEVIQEYSSDQQYAVEDLTNILTFSEDLLKRAKMHVDKLDGKLQVKLPENVNYDELPDKFIDLLYSDDKVYNLFVNPKEHFKDRSAADMKLVNILYHDVRKFTISDAVSVLANTEKAIEKCAYRFSYAEATVGKVYCNNVPTRFKSLAEIKAGGLIKRQLKFINTTYFFDCLGEPFARTKVLGLIAGSGGGKTSITLQMMYDAIINNPDSDDIYVFFSLEMPLLDIYSRWERITQGCDKAHNRFYVIDTTDEKGDPRYIGLQEIYDDVVALEKYTGKKVDMLAIDHIGIMSLGINIKHKYTFGIHQESVKQTGDIRTLSLNTAATQLKTLAKLLDVFIICLTQTTKEKGKGDTPIDKDGAYGISQYENIMDYIITVWRPLMRIQYLIPEHHFLAWHYVKVREKRNNDQVREYQNQVLSYNMDTGILSAPTEEQFAIFEANLGRAEEVRKKLEKKETKDYSKTLPLEKLKELKIMIEQKSLPMGA